MWQKDDTRPIHFRAHNAICHYTVCRSVKLSEFIKTLGCGLLNSKEPFTWYRALFAVSKPAVWCFGLVLDWLGWAPKGLNIPTMHSDSDYNAQLCICNLQPEQNICTITLPPLPLINLLIHPSDFALGKLENMCWPLHSIMSALNQAEWNSWSAGPAINLKTSTEMLPWPPDQHRLALSVQKTHTGLTLIQSSIVFCISRAKSSLKIRQKGDMGFQLTFIDGLQKLQ